MQAAGKAQVSLEYLLLLAVLFGSFAMIAPKILESYNAMVFASDAQNAKAFCEKLSSTIEKTGFFENASSERIKAFPELKWILLASGSEVKIRVESKTLEKIKEVKCNSKVEVAEFEQSFTKAFSLRVQKAGGKVSIVNN
ncbi:MAG: hypothetical protein Q7R70_06640 [Candidatus Diapherotrites archaeon]|nr:hypothetical protein [Candidatus Diapherotrites archaeon]